MKYLKVTTGKFISRPNRFIANVEVDGKLEVCHVKNTGRCRELLVPGAKVVLEISDNPSRKTLYDVIAVYKSDVLINMDSQAPNKVFLEWLKKTDFFGEINLIKPETKYNNSRFDFYIEVNERKIFIEVKGVTLEENGVVLFPDAPTERGVKHLTELVDAIEDGYESYVFFIIQMKNCKYFTPNKNTHSEFDNTLKYAKGKGVKIFALNCNVKENELTIDEFIDVLIM